MLGLPAPYFLCIPYPIHLSSGSHSGDLGLGTRKYADDRIVVQLLTVLVCLLPAILVCGLELGLALYQVLALCSGRLYRNGTYFLNSLLRGRLQGLCASLFCLCLYSEWKAAYHHVGNYSSALFWSISQEHKETTLSYLFSVYQRC